MSESGSEPAGSLVRSFMVTGGRTSTTAQELAVETIVGRADNSESLRDSLQFESRAIYDYLETDDASVAEISAHLNLPILATLVLVGDLLADGVLSGSELADVVDVDFLMRIRQHIEAI